MIEVLLETNELIFIDKPQGISSQPGESAGRAVPLLLEESIGYKPYLLHRLDRDTSGVMVLAKNADAAKKWSLSMADGAFSKTYFAFVFNHPAKESGVIDTDIEQRGKSVSAITKYKTIMNASLGDFQVSLLSLELGTGRMHQIRIHLNGIGVPIIGDDKHGNFSLNKIFAKTYKVNRLMLLAKILKVDVSSASMLKPIVVEAEWPDRFTRLAGLCGIDLAGINEGRPSLDA